MKAQIRKSDNTVGRFWPDAKTLELNGEQLTVSEGGVIYLVDPDATTENTTIVEGLDAVSYTHLTLPTIYSV